MVITSHRLITFSDVDELQNACRKMGVGVQDSEARLSFIAVLAQKYFDLDGEEEIFEMISKKFDGQSAGFIDASMQKAQSVQVPSKIKVKRSFWQKVCCKPREYVTLSPLEILAKKVDEVLKM